MWIIDGVNSAKNIPSDIHKIANTKDSIYRIHEIYSWEQSSPVFVEVSSLTIRKYLFNYRTPPIMSSESHLETELYPLDFSDVSSFFPVVFAY